LGGSPYNYNPRLANAAALLRHEEAATSAAGALDADSNGSDAQQLHQALLLLKRNHCLNISTFCREAIAEKLKQLERLEAVE